MPVRFLNSSILRWPSKKQVDGALRQWVLEQDECLDDVMALGYFGSYARGTAGKGSDLDVVAILTESHLPFHQRSTHWNFLSIPVPVEAQIYTRAEWQQLAVNQPRFYNTLLQETVWIIPLSQ
ncbi:nucleotidyltransferase domain-containing protein [Oscillatoria sp. CS-180]|uniref:nucleotidyltransferase domain-containing protein n=1 Tax=Oscillatoria sp. CS-180 TaxID=3021720 RepID=UPI00232CF921|nr:nucleotidyltransferase domain-containing protein [Oscillatoria sp. CS-180]MDB9525791.1 nucleotidyltransferase domain-containing protein [Oscillatoria sp. CS-180]